MSLSSDGAGSIHSIAHFDLPRKKVYRRARRRFRKRASGVLHALSRRIWPCERRRQKHRAQEILSTFFR